MWQTQAEINHLLGNKTTVSNKNSTGDIFNFIPSNFYDESMTNNMILFMAIDAVALKSTDKYANFLTDAAKKIGDFSIKNLETIKVVDGATDAAKDLYEEGKKFVDSVTANGVVGAVSSEVESLYSDLTDKLLELNSEAENGADTDEKAMRATWFLPLPNELKTAIKHNYQTDALDPLDKITKSKSFNMINVARSGVSTVGEKTGIAGKIVTYPLKKVMDTDKIARFAETGMNIAKRHNVSLDTNIVNIYKGTNTRNFTFNYTIMPQSQEHAFNIMNAILNLKKYMTGFKEYEIVKQGNVFRLRFLEFNPDTNESNNAQFIDEIMFTNGVDFNITDIDITYGADGGMSMFADGMPKVITMSLKIEERKPLYKIEEDKQ